MREIQQGLSGLWGGLLRLLLWGLAAALAVLLLAFALVLLTVGALWAVVRGRRPSAPVFMARWRTVAQGQGWPRPGPTPGAPAADVVDVQAREVPEVLPVPDRDDLSRGRRP